MRKKLTAQKLKKQSKQRIGPGLSRTPQFLGKPSNPHPFASPSESRGKIHWYTGSVVTGVARYGLYPTHTYQALLM